MDEPHPDGVDELHGAFAEEMPHSGGVRAWQGIRRRVNPADASRSMSIPCRFRRSYSPTASSMGFPTTRWSCARCSNACTGASRRQGSGDTTASTPAPPSMSAATRQCECPAGCHPERAAGPVWQPDAAAGGRAVGRATPGPALAFNGLRGIARVSAAVQATQGQTVSGPAGIVGAASTGCSQKMAGASKRPPHVV